MEPSTPPPSRPSSVPKPTNSTPKNSKTCSESPPLTETSWTTKDWPTLSPTVKPTRKFNLFTFWSQPIHLFCCLFFRLFPVSLLSLSSAAFVALFITTSIIDKKKTEHTIFEIFFEQQHIKQQQR